MRRFFVGLVAIGWTLLVLFSSAPATAVTNPGGSGGSCTPTWKGKPGDHAHSFAARITSDPCHRKVRGAALCMVSTVSGEPPGTWSVSTYWVYGPSRRHAGTTSTAVCPYGPPSVYSSVQKYGISYKTPSGWRKSTKSTN